MKTYIAPWSKLLVGTSILLTAIFCTPSVVLLLDKTANLPPWIWICCLAAIPAAALFMVRSYTITGDAILIQRLFWTTRLSLEGLKSARFDPQAAQCSIRFFGNGGFFSFTGWYWNSVLRRYQAFATDPSRLVILKFERRTVVISPDKPEEFINSLPNPSH